MKSMEKLDILRTAGADPKLAEAIVKIQEESAYITKDYLDARLSELESGLLVKLVLAMVAVAGLSLAIARVLFG
jgi:hypothetical protein